jgi:hypothetical protein
MTKNKTFTQIWLIVIIIILGFSNIVYAQDIPLNLNNEKEKDIIFKPIQYTEALTPIFSFFSKTFEVCRQQNICSVGQYKEYAPVTNVIIFKGEKQPRYKRDAIMWEIKFLEFAPTKITYGTVPYNGREIVKAKPLSVGDTYTVCVYPKNSSVNCEKWEYKD